MHPFNLTCDCLYSEQANALLEMRPHLISPHPVFIHTADIERIVSIVAAVERVVALPTYQTSILDRAAPIAYPAFGPHGAFVSYDFHLTESGPQLIEINTNAGGALINAIAQQQGQRCCGAQNGNSQLAELKGAFIEMFLNEWHSQRNTLPLRQIAIVDDAPTTQYLYPEFLLFQQLFQEYGMDCIIADAKDLVARDNALWHNDIKIDLVYNRLTDFMLTNHAALRKAYANADVVLTPHPRAYALYADKRNLAVLSDTMQLQMLGVDASTRTILGAALPTTTLVDDANLHRLWAQRRQLFFKPIMGFGSKGAYRGDKLTRKVFTEIARGHYVAQRQVAPPERHVIQDGQKVTLKWDLRAYMYRGVPQLLAVRLYQGQTTNFRTPGGGFAPILYIKKDSDQRRRLC